jgi:ribA/ribD-fused uncharacterized protein
VADILLFKDEHAYLSNFYPSEIVFALNHEWRHAPTLEHAFQATKMRYPHHANEILLASTPGKAKRLGQAGDRRPDWEDIKSDLMLDLLFAKFKQNDLLSGKLFETGTAHLVEGNWWHDLTWGQCGTGAPCSKGIHHGEGENLLGEHLMTVRFFLQHSMCVPTTLGG